MGSDRQEASSAPADLHLLKVVPSGARVLVHLVVARAGVRAVSLEGVALVDHPADEEGSKEDREQEDREVEALEGDLGRLGQEVGDLEKVVLKEGLQRADLGPLVDDSERQQLV